LIFGDHGAVLADTFLTVEQNQPDRMGQGARAQPDACQVFSSNNSLVKHRPIQGTA
jgi:hypothetical protein